MSSYAEHITTAHIQCDAEKRCCRHILSLLFLSRMPLLRMKPKSRRIMAGLNISVMPSTPLTVFYIAICRLSH